MAAASLSVFFRDPQRLLCLLVSAYHWCLRLAWSPPGPCSSGTRSFPPFTLDFLLPAVPFRAASGWAGIDSLLQQLPGQQFELCQGSDEQGMPVERRQGGGKAAAEAAAAAASGRRRRVMVVFIGGVTCAEVRRRAVLLHRTAMRCAVLCFAVLCCAVLCYCAGRVQQVHIFPLPGAHLLPHNRRCLRCAS